MFSLSLTLKQSDTVHAAFFLNLGLHENGGFYQKFQRHYLSADQDDLSRLKIRLIGLSQLQKSARTFQKNHLWFLRKSRKLHFFSNKKVSSDTRHALKPFQTSYKHFSALKHDKNVKFAQNFLKLLLWFLSSIFLLFMIHNHGNL